jgi:hypothetical protein
MDDRLSVIRQEKNRQIIGRACRQQIWQLFAMTKPEEFTLRDAIAVRLRALQKVAGATDQQMGNYVGMSRTAWANAVALNSKKPNKPPEEAMVRLCERAKLTMDWIYRGTYDNVPYALAIALQEALSGGASGVVELPGLNHPELENVPGLVDHQG